MDDASRAKKIEACARAAHEANRNYCYAIGEQQPPWEEAPDWLRMSVIDGVQKALNGATPREMHENWCAYKVAEGWTRGEKKDPEAKTHPQLLSYDELPPAQKVKDEIYISAVRSMAKALGLGIVEPETKEPGKRKTARQLYERYVEASGGKNFVGDPCPTWDALPEKIRGNWEAVASYARD